MEKEYMTLAEVARQLGTRADRLTEFCLLPDPMPVRYLPGRVSSGFVIVSELNGWLERNTALYRDRRKNGK